MDQWDFLRVPFSTAMGGVNSLGSLARRAGVRLVPLDQQRLLEQAQRQTGCRDFGASDLQEPLGTLIDALRDEEANLHFIGRLSARYDILRLLRNRLQLEQDWKENPDIENEAIAKPLFIVGLPRSGTTLLQNLLAQDPTNRFPTHWEIMYPSPPPAAASRSDIERRIARVRRQFRWLDLMAPELKTIHPLSAESPQECTEITTYSFSSLRFDTLYEIPSYVRWLNGHGYREAYAFHRRFLQYLQWRCPSRRWILKSPDHVFALKELLAFYPDAGIVMTHRDPLKVLPSLASLTSVLQRFFKTSVDPKAIGTKQSQVWADGASQLVNVRTSGYRQDRFLDIHYLELMRRPVATVERIYDHFGLALTDEAIARMKRFVAEHPKNQHGNHSYSLEQFALDPAEQRERYAFYMKCFGVEPETA